MKEIKSIPKLLAEAQKVFNKFIRERDKDNGCISCPTGRVEHASHYLSQGHHGHLRFNEINVNGSCLRCNKFLHGNLISYRSGLIKKVGEQKVLLLESQAHSVKKWSRIELETIIKMYKNE